MSILDRYLTLAKQKRFAEGLSVIEEIVRTDPKVPTSQFNHGVCLAELGRYRDAATAFLRAYSLDSEDGGALYRGCLALAIADDAHGLLDVFKQECVRDPAMIKNFLAEKRFERFWRLPEFQNLKNEFWSEAFS